MPLSSIIFVVFFLGGGALRSKALVFVGRTQICHFRRFRQNALFSAGCFAKCTVLATLAMLMEKGPPLGSLPKMRV